MPSPHPHDFHAPPGPCPRRFSAPLKIAGLWLVFFLLWTWDGGFLFRFPWFILSGDFFRVIFSGDLLVIPFQKRHAGMALDQPSIGKYLVWFSVFSTMAAACAWMVRKRTVLTDRMQYAAFAVPLLLAAFWSLSILSWPACLLVQYMATFGPTPMRVLGAVMVFISGLGWILWTVALLSRKENPGRLLLPALAFLAVPAGIAACFSLFLIYQSFI